MARRERPLNGQLTEREVLVLVAVLVPVAPGCGTTSCTPAGTSARSARNRACPTGYGPTGTAATTSWISTPVAARVGPVRRPDGTRRLPPRAGGSAGVPNGLPDLPASSEALIRTDAADSLSQ